MTITIRSKIVPIAVGVLLEEPISAGVQRTQISISDGQCRLNGRIVEETR